MISAKRKHPAKAGCLFNCSEYWLPDEYVPGCIIAKNPAFAVTLF